MRITKKDVEEVADAIGGRFERDIVRLVTMGLSVDEDFGDCIRIVVYLDEDTTMEDIKGRTGGVTAQVMGILRDELKDLWPFVGFKRYSEDNDADPLPDQGREADQTDSAPTSNDVPEGPNAHGAGTALRERPAKITKQDVTEVADSIRGWCDRSIVRRVTMEPSADEELRGLRPDCRLPRRRHGEGEQRGSSRWGDCRGHGHSESRAEGSAAARAVL